MAIANDETWQIMRGTNDDWPLHQQPSLIQSCQPLLTMTSSPWQVRVVVSHRPPLSMQHDSWSLCQLPINSAFRIDRFWPVLTTINHDQALIFSYWLHLGCFGALVPTNVGSPQMSRSLTGPLGSSKTTRNTDQRWTKHCGNTLASTSLVIIVNKQQTQKK